MNQAFCRHDRCRYRMREGGRHQLILTFSLISICSPTDRSVARKKHNVRRTTTTSVKRAQVLSDGRAPEVYRTAAQIILEKGYDATSVSDIAKALRITKAGLYHYIHGKTQLLFDIMQYGLDELEREVAEPVKKIADAETRLRFMIGMHARIVTRGEGR